MSPPPHAEASQRVSFLCGFVAGVAQAGIFNPFDRALYLSVKHHRPFLSYQNFFQPYSGFLQSVGGRALSGGLYVIKRRSVCMNVMLAWRLTTFFPLVQLLSTGTHVYELCTTRR